MQHTTYPYKNQEFNIKVNRMPIWFVETQSTGDPTSGSIILETKTVLDELWGPIGKLEITWESCDESDYYHPRVVKRNIESYTSIGVAFTRKKNDWVNNHMLTIWYGIRRKLIKSNYYEEQSIHGIFHCEFTKRILEFNASILKEHFQGFEIYLIDALYSIECH
ncbi:MAG: hypothetical protein JW891_00985 [Candidatus Lokiarchaeota archaeon]|nr:hypothetical protein [Candidatus Lokiarchaeota archaeon]